MLSHVTVGGPPALSVFSVSMVVSPHPQVPDDGRDQKDHPTLGLGHQSSHSSSGWDVSERSVGVPVFKCSLHAPPLVDGSVESPPFTTLKYGLPVCTSFIPRS